jgi:hypothetical protein
VLLLALGIATLTPSCSGDECVVVSSDCAPLYAPEFDEIFARTLQPTCAASGGSCHAPEGMQGGLAFADVDSSYAALVDGGDAARVLAGDPGCSLVVRKLESTEADVQMPPGAPLSEQERCVMVQWIAGGAKR